MDAALIDDNDFGAFATFDSPGPMQPEDDAFAKSNSEDVFGESLADLNVWDIESPKGEKKEKIEDSGKTGDEEKDGKSQKKRRSRSRGRLERSNSQRERRGSSTKRSSSRKRSGSSKPTREIRRSRSKGRNAAAVEKQRGKSKDTKRERIQRSRSASGMKEVRRERTQRSQSEDTNTSEDRIGELMALIRKENPSGPLSSVVKLPNRRISAPPTLGSNPAEFKKKLLEERRGSTSSRGNTRTSYLSRKVCDRVYGADFRKSASDTRRASVKDSLQSFLKDSSTDYTPREGLAGRSVTSAPTVSTRPRSRVRRTNSQSGKVRPTKGGIGLEAHLRSSRVGPTGDREHRSVVTAPASSSSLSEKCQKMKLQF